MGVDLTPTLATVVRAQRFELVDGDGKLRAVLGLGEPGTDADVQRVLRNRAGKLRAVLSLSEAGAGPVVGLGLADAEARCARA